MFEKMKCRMVLMSLMIAVAAGLVTGGTLWVCENGKCLCKKAKQAFKTIE